MELANGLRRFVVRQDPVYDDFVERYQARTAWAKAFYIVMHLLPGIFGIIVINVLPVYLTLRDFSGLNDKYFQYAIFLLVTYIWHMLVPFLVLRYSDKLDVRQSLAFMGLDRIDMRGLLIFLPVFFVAYTIVFIPYFAFVYQPLFDWLSSIPFAQMPDYSIFKHGLYDFPPFLLLILLVGNFLGEELYYRAYLMKKCAFMGAHTWWITSILFVVYHFWQIPATYSLVLPALAFGLVMKWRKDLYVVIVLHFLLNLWWVDWMADSFSVS